MRRGTIALLVGSVLGCGSELVQAPPLPSDGVHSILYRAQSLGSLTYFGAAPSEVVRFEVPEPLEGLVAFLYAEDGEALQLGPGLLPLPSDPLSTRPLPEPKTTMIYAAGTWQETPFAPYFESRLDAFDYPRCVAAGGCTLPDGTPNRCVIPCPILPAPAPPLLPEPTCPPGWLHPADDRCAPDEPPTLDCAIAERQPIGADRCELVGSTCSADGWPAGVTAELYVRPGASGTGARLDPLGSLDAAIAMASPGGVIALSSGVHPASAGFLVTRDVELVGACASATFIEWNGTGPLFSVDASRLTITDLTLGGDSPIAAGPRSEIALDAVIIGAGPGVGLGVVGGRATLSRSVVRQRSLGGIVTSTSSLTIVDSSLVANTRYGLAGHGSTVSLDRLRVSGASIPPGDPSPALAGFGLWFQGGVVSGGDLVLDGGDRGGLNLADGGSGDLHDLIVRDSGDAAISSYAIVVQNSELVLSRAQLTRTKGHGLYAEMARIALTDFLVEDICCGLGGILLAGPVTGSVDRARFENSRPFAILADNSPELEIRDLTVRGGIQDPSNRFSASVVLRGGQVTLERALIEDSEVWAFNARTVPGMVVRDLTLRRSVGGLIVDRFGGATFERIAVDDCVEAGVSVEVTQCTDGPCAPITIADLSIRGMKSGRLAPVGLSATLSSIVDVRGFEIADGEGTGMVLDASDGAASASRGDIHGNAVGISVKERISLALAGVRVHDNAKDLEVVR